MDSPATSSTIWPTESQLLLLRASLLSGPAALDAWRSWTSRHDLVESPLDRGSVRLLPLLSRNLAAHGVDEPSLGRLRGTHRYAWSANHQVLHASASALGALHAAGVGTIVLRGAALATLHYRDVGARPFFDVDVLVRPREAAAAVDALARAGWLADSVSERVLGSSVSERVLGSARGWRGSEARGSEARGSKARGFEAPGFAPLAGTLRFGHSVRVRKGATQELALHWHAFPDCPGEHADDGLWARAVALSLAGVDTRALDATDCLLHTVVGGLRWHPEPRIRWVADATLVLREAGERIAWDRLLAEAAARRLELRVAAALAYLRDALDVPVPAAVLHRLSARRATRRERAEFRAAALSPEDCRHPVLGAIPAALAEYRRLAADLSFALKVGAFPDYLRHACAAPERAPLLPLVLRQIRRTTRRLLAPIAPAAPLSK